MAVKGKRKSQTRGSQGRRRPAAMPRPAQTAQKVPFHRMLEGRIAIGIILALVIGIIWYAVANAQSETEDLDARQQGVETYTESVAALLQTVSGPAGEMQALAAPPEGDALANLRRDARRWSRDLAASQAQIATLGQEPEFRGTSQVLTQSVLLFTNAAETYALVPEVDAAAAADVFARAGAQRDQANALWASGIALLDEARADAELSPSGILTPGAAGAEAQRQSSPAPDDGGDNDQGGSGGGGG